MSLNNNSGIVSLCVCDAQGRYQSATPAQIFAAARQAVEQQYARGTAMSTPEVVRDYLQKKLCGFPHEVFAILLLDSQHRLLDYIELFRGTIDSASVYPREVVKESLTRNAAAVILTHNHPSGVPEPSAADRALTQRLKDALALIDVRVLDHIVVGGQNTVSFAERGWV
jgi:DNA repair protein RadC